MKGLLRTRSYTPGYFQALTSQKAEDLDHWLTLILILITWPFGEVKKTVEKKKKRRIFLDQKYIFNANTIGLFQWELFYDYLWLYKTHLGTIL